MPDLSDSQRLANLVEEMAKLRQELEILKTNSGSQAANPGRTATSRRRLLKGLAASALGVGLGAQLLNSGTQAQARVVILNTPDIGQLVLLKSTGYSNTPTGSYGLVASGESTTLDLTTLPNGSKLGVYGRGPDFGVYGESAAGVGVQAKSGSGAPLGIMPGAVPGSGSLGQFYVNSGSKAFYFHDGTSWQQVAPLSIPTDVVQHPAGAGNYNIVAAGIVWYNTTSLPIYPIYNGLSLVGLDYPTGTIALTFNGYTNPTKPNSNFQYIIKALAYCDPTTSPPPPTGGVIVNFGQFTDSNFTLRLFDNTGATLSPNYPSVRIMVEVSRF